jgi:hypothetical protein
LTSQSYAHVQSEPAAHIRRLKRRIQQLDKLIARGLPGSSQKLAIQERAALAWAVPILEAVVRRAEERGDG